MLKGTRKHQKTILQSENIDTVIYLIRHSEQYRDYIYNSDLENERERNKKIILSVNGEEKFGKIDMDNIKNVKFDFTKMQLLDSELKNMSGESSIEVRKRMQEAISEIIKNNKEKKIAIVSHGAAIKFYLLNYCNLNEELKLEYNGKELEIASPCLLKLAFRNNKLVDLEQIKLV